MYTTFYGLSGPPFKNTPDPDFFFMSAGHQRALLFLLYAIREKKGLITVCGQAGTGKTALLQVIEREIGQSVKMIFFLDAGSMGSSVSLSGYLLEKLGISATGLSRDNFGLLRDGLLQQIQQGISVVLVVDEAQNLDWRQLEQIRLLLNLETSDCKLLSIILVGQPELQNKLNQPTFQQLKQRIDLSCQIDPLTETESYHYIEFRLKRAGRDRQDIFTPEALQTIYLRTQGIPRLINNICDKALLLGFSRQQQYIDRTTIQELSLLFENQRGNPPPSSSRTSFFQQGWSQLPGSGSLRAADEGADRRFQIRDFRYQMIDSDKRVYSWRTPPAALWEGEETRRFIQEGLRAILGQYGRQQQQGGREAEDHTGGRRGAIGERPPQIPEDSRGRAACQQKASPAASSQSGQAIGKTEGKPPLEAAQSAENPDRREAARPKPLSSEYIKRFESISLASSSGKKQRGGWLLGWFQERLHSLHRLIIRRRGHPLPTRLDEQSYCLPSKVIEEYQKIKNNLYQANPTSRLQALMFASANSGEGASTVAANFATTCALTEEAKVLLVDANFRAPKLHSLFGLPRSEGLGEVLREKVGWRDVVRACKIPNLSIITAGEPAINPLYLLRSATLERTIQEFREQFDYVLFDTCAIYLYADPILLGAYLDGLILVVQAGKTRLETIRKTREILTGSVPIMGVVLNRRNYYIPQALYRRL